MYALYICELVKMPMIYEMEVCKASVMVSYCLYLDRLLG